MKIVAIMGKAGSGKDTILHKILDKYPEQFNEIISCTTRPPREGESNGVNYHFISVSQFTEKVLNGDMLEATEFNGWHYGTALSSLSEDKINIGVFNPTGIYCLLENHDINLYVYYICANDKNRLLRQLNREKEPDIKEIIRRYSADEKDFLDIDDINYTVLFNNDLEQLNMACRLIGADLLN